MFSFFTKKEYLVDHLEGFVDIHNHILPSIDDGAKNVEESIQLIKGFGEFGVTNFICTPHIMENYYPNTPETINSSLKILQNILKKNNLTHVKIAAAAEHMIDSNFETILEKGAIMPIAKNYLLVEMSYLQPFINFEEAMDKIMSSGYFPILAHPERYTYLHNTRKYGAYKKKGILFQMNILSLSDYYGKEVQQTTYKLLQQGLTDFVASDVHNLNQLNNLREIRVTKKMGDLLKPIIMNTNFNFLRTF